FLEQATHRSELRRGELRVEEEFAGVVAGLSVDVDGSGVVGGPGVVEPEGVGKPGIGGGEQDDLAGSGVVEVQRGAIVSGEGAIDAGQFGEEVADAGDVL